MRKHKVERIRSRIGSRKASRGIESSSSMRMERVCGTCSGPTLTCLPREVEHRSRSGACYQTSRIPMETRKGRRSVRRAEKERKAGKGRKTTGQRRSQQGRRGGGMTQRLAGKRRHPGREQPVCDHARRLKCYFRIGGDEGRGREHEHGFCEPTPRPGSSTVVAGSCLPPVNSPVGQSPAAWSFWRSSQPSSSSSC